MPRKTGGEPPHILRRVMIAFALLILIGCLLWSFFNKPRPRGTPGNEAEALAQQMLRAVNADAWRRTGAIRFTFNHHHHLWDRRRSFDEVRTGNQYVLLDLRNHSGRAWNGGSETHGDDLNGAIENAYAAWVNDSFWLNPVVKIYDAGVRRSIVRSSSGNGLFVEYSSGGLTPGDAYLWTVDSNGMPAKWRMWVHILPIGGMSTTWEDWVTLSTGAKVSTLHRMGPLYFRLRDVAGAVTLSELTKNSDDPFRSIAAH